MNILCIKVIQSITIHKGGCYSDLKTAIQSRLGVPFNKISLKIYIIWVRNIIEMKMDIHKNFILRNLKQNTSISLFTSNNFLYHVVIYSQFLCNVGQFLVRFFYFLNKVLLQRPWDNTSKGRSLVNNVGVIMPKCYSDLILPESLSLGFMSS